MYFVAGITGHVGAAAARKLLAAGKKVSSVVRDPVKAAQWNDQGVQLITGDWTDAAALTKAMQGVEGAFVMVPPNIAPEPGYPESKAVIAAVKEAVASAKPQKVVALSSMGSEQTSGLGLITATHLLEEALKTQDVPVAFVRAGSFLENFLGGLDGAAATGNFYSMYQPASLKVPYIATEDIGNTVAELLTTEWQGKRIVELGTLYTGDEIAAAIGKGVGRDVKFAGVPREQWAKTLEGFGFPVGKTGAYEEMVDGLNSGWIHFGNAGTEAKAATITPEQFYVQARKAGAAASH